MARQKGLEPLAYCLEGSCSIQLSYWRIDQTMERVTGIEPASPAWKAGALAIVLHPHAPSVEIVSLVIIAYEHGICQEENRFLKKVFSSFSLRGTKKYGMIGKLTNICSGIEVVITGLTRNQFGAIHVGSNPTRCAKKRSHPLGWFLFLSEGIRSLCPSG